MTRLRRTATAAALVALMTFPLTGAAVADELPVPATPGVIDVLEFDAIVGNYNPASPCCPTPELLGVTRWQLHTALGVRPVARYPFKYGPSPDWRLIGRAYPTDWTDEGGVPVTALIYYVRPADKSAPWRVAYKTFLAAELTPAP